MRRWIWITVIAVLVLGGGFWFWTLAALPSQEPGGVVLKVDRPPVLVKRPGATDFEAADTGLMLTVGSTVKTGSGGQATLTFFNQAESRLDENSELTLAETKLDPDDPTELQVQLKLSLGRIWSRVLRLFDLDSRFAIQTSSVVATVRGTSFDVRANADRTTELWVNEAAVTVSRVGEEERLPVAPATTTALAEGYTARYTAAGAIEKVQPISAEARASRWFQSNVTSDAAYVRAERTRRREELRRLGGPRPDSVFDGVARWSERTHILFAPTAGKDRLAEQYLARRLAGLIELAEAGKTGLASQEFARLENSLRTRYRGASGARERKRLKVALARISLLVEDAPATSVIYPFKQRLEDLTSSLSREEDRAVLLYTRLLAVDARLDEAGRFLDEQTLEEARLALDAAKTGIENVERDAKPIIPGLAVRQRLAIRTKINALIAREEAQRVRFRAALQVPPVEASVATTTQPLVPPPPAAVKPSPTPTQPIKPDAPLPITTQPPQYSGISVFVQPNPINVGQAAQLIVRAKRLEGGEEEVTAKTKFSLARGQGNLNGPIFTGTVAGSVTLLATLLDNGTTHTGQANLEVVGTAVLQSVSVTAQSTGLKSGESTLLTAVAKYSNGYTKNVTTSVVWKNLNPTLGTLTGSRFTAASKGSGTVEITATHTEEGASKTGSVFITVSETQPTGVPLFPTGQ